MGGPDITRDTIVEFSPTTVRCTVGKCKWKATCPGPTKAWAEWVIHNQEVHQKTRYAIAFDGSPSRGRRRKV